MRYPRLVIREVQAGVKTSKSLYTYIKTRTSMKDINKRVNQDSEIYITAYTSVIVVGVCCVVCFYCVLCVCGWFLYFPQPGRLTLHGHAVDRTDWPWIWGKQHHLVVQTPSGKPEFIQKFLDVSFSAVEAKPNHFEWKCSAGFPQEMIPALADLHGSDYAHTRVHLLYTSQSRGSHVRSYRYSPSAWYYCPWNAWWCHFEVFRHNTP